MTKEERELFVLDLSARILYGTIVNIKGHAGLKLYDFDEELYSVFIEGDYVSINDRGSGDEEGICEIRPYLRRMSSMTVEEKEKLASIENVNSPYPAVKYSQVDYLNSIYVDYRGLIDNGLALEAPADMYK